jgi:hypothetical protein
MAPERLSRLQRRILAWLAQEETRTRGTMAASHPDLVQALAHDKGNLSHSLTNLAAMGLIRISRTPWGASRERHPHGRGSSAPRSGHRKL